MATTTAPIDADTVMSAYDGTIHSDDSGDDSAGSLVDFVVDDDDNDDEGIAVPAPVDEVTELLDEAKSFVGDSGESHTVREGCRRSTRQRRATQFYIDPDYEAIMARDGAADAAFDGDVEEDSDIAEESDSSFAEADSTTTPLEMDDSDNDDSDSEASWTP